MALSSPGRACTVDPTAGTRVPAPAARTATGGTVLNPPSTKGRRIAKINRFTQAKLIEAMLDGVYTCAELAEMTGLHYVTVLDYTRELHRAKAAHICGWEKDAKGRDVIKIYKIGRGKDAKREKMSGAERQARTRAKRKAFEFAHLLTGGVHAQA